MDNDERHPHFCDCDTCLNGGTGVRIGELRRRSAALDRCRLDKREQIRRRRERADRGLSAMGAAE